jgi:primosomal protein N' (replication factor Y)
VHCHGSRFRALRPGIARVRDDLAALLPRTPVVAVDAKTATLPAVPVLVGTEAVLHRVDPAASRVGLVAYLELDQELLAPRARAAEQAMWLLVRGARLLASSGLGSLLLQTRLPEHEVVRAAVEGDPLMVVDAERARRRVLGFPPFGGVAELSGDPVAVAAACDTARGGAVTVLGPVDDGRRALLRAVSTSELCDALAQPGIDAAHTLGRLRVDVDPRRV